MVALVEDDAADAAGGCLFFLRLGHAQGRRPRPKWCAAQTLCNPLTAVAATLFETTQPPSAYESSVGSYQINSHLCANMAQRVLARPLHCTTQRRVGAGKEPRTRSRLHPGQRRPHPCNALPRQPCQA
eukprot:gene41014-50744_t